MSSQTANIEATPRISPRTKTSDQSVKGRNSSGFNPAKGKLNRSNVTDSVDFTSTKISSLNKTNKRCSFFCAAVERQQIRHDAYGTLIVKGQKEHKVTFIDNISKNKLSEMILFNHENKKTNSAIEPCTCSGCSIF